MPAPRPVAQSHGPEYHDEFIPPLDSTREFIGHRMDPSGALVSHVARTETNEPVDCGSVYTCHDVSRQDVLSIVRSCHGPSQAPTCERNGTISSQDGRVVSRGFHSGIGIDLFSTLTSGSGHKPSKTIHFSITGRREGHDDGCIIIISQAIHESLFIDSGTTISGTLRFIKFDLWHRTMFN